MIIQLIIYFILDLMIKSVQCINKYQCLVFPQCALFVRAKFKAKLHMEHLTHIYIAVQNHVTINKFRNKNSNQNNKASLESSYPWYSLMPQIFD